MKRKTRFRIGSFIPVVLVLIGVALGLINNALPLPPQARNIAWPLFIGLTVLLLIGTTISNRTSSDASLHASEHPKLLRRLQNHYRDQRRPLFDADDRLEYRDRHQREERFLTLTLCKQPDAITICRQQQASPKRDEQRPSYFPSTHLLQMYDDAEGQLLILGEPGSGKTMLLYELADELADRLLDSNQHAHDDTIPIVFNLASWAIKQPPLTEWLVEALGQQYKGKKVLEKFAEPTFAQRLVDQHKILPLLDGLDEVPEKCQRACIDAINIYLEKNELSSVVVCSRTSEYCAHNTPLRLQSVVVVQPLTPQQVSQYIAALEQPPLGTQQPRMCLEGLRQALPRDQELLELATTPLMLHVLTHAYNGVPVGRFRAAGSLTKRQQQVFEAYVNRMLDRRDIKRYYSPPQAKRYLECLARQMAYCNLTEFRVEQLEPEWLPPDHRAQQFYYSLAMRLMVEVPFLARSVVLYALLIGLLFSTVFAIFGGLAGGLNGLVSGFFKYLPLLFIGGGILGVEREAYKDSTGEGEADLRLFFKRTLRYSGYLRFLDYAAASLLLRKGQDGRYTFMHRLLLEYFVTLHTAPTPLRMTTSAYEGIRVQGRFSADKVLEVVRRKQAPSEWTILDGNQPLLPGCFPTLMWGKYLLIPSELLGAWLTSSWSNDLHWFVISSIATIWLASPFVVTFYKLHHAKRHPQLAASVIITPLGVVDYKDAKHMQTIDFARVTSIGIQEREGPQGVKLEYLSISYGDRTHEDYSGLQNRYHLQPTSDIQYTGGMILPRYQATRRDFQEILVAYSQFLRLRASFTAAGKDDLLEPLF